jgi:flavin reductase (DIM6/NTAB) family NADH-FMN oxidoreductase RutF
MTPTASESSLAAALGRVPSGIFILTVRHDEQETGMLASWVMQAGFDPPAVTVCIRQGRYVADWLKAGRPFVLNVVAEKQNDLLKHFGKGFPPEADAFVGLEVDRTSGGLTVLRSALAHLECKPTSRWFDSGDHHVFLAEVTGGRLADDRSPMVHVRKNGLNY